jgi:hypothetical protein
LLINVQFTFSIACLISIKQILQKILVGLIHCFLRVVRLIVGLDLNILTVLETETTMRFFIERPDRCPSLNFLIISFLACSISFKSGLLVKSKLLCSGFKRAAISAWRSHNANAYGVFRLCLDSFCTRRISKATQQSPFH